MKWYPRYPGDYKRDTSHLSLAEHGAYAVLLDAFYATKRPIPAGSEYRVAGAQDDSERAAVDSVLAQFWSLADGGWTNARAVAEIKKAAERSDKARRAADARWSAPNNANASPEQCERISDRNAHSHARAMPPQPQPQPRDQERSMREELGVDTGDHAREARLDPDSGLPDGMAWDDDDGG